jgi:capsular polysaccharide biosynthesis protein
LKMNKKVFNNLPINLESEHICLFKNRQKYSFPLLKIKHMKNVFVSHWGLLVKRLLLPFRSAENLVGCYDKTFYFKFWRKAIEQYLVCRYGKSLSFIKYKDDREYFTIHTPWFGYFSWLATNLPRLIRIREYAPEAILLLPEEIGKYPYVSESLKLFPELQIQEVKQGHHMFIKKYVYCEVKPWTSRFDISDLQKVRKLYFDYLAKNRVQLSGSPFIYISRKNAKRRRIINEPDVESYLHANGFKSICTEELSVFEQISIMQQAKVIIALHGAGLANIIFMSQDASVLELTPLPGNIREFRFPYWRIADLLNINYHVQFCDTVNNAGEDIYERDVKVNMEQFISKCEKMMNK